MLVPSRSCSSFKELLPGKYTHETSRNGIAKTQGTRAVENYHDVAADQRR